MEEKEEQDLRSLFGLACVFLLSPPPSHRQVVLRRVVVRAGRQTSKQQVLIHMTRLEGGSPFLDIHQAAIPTILHRSTCW